MLRGILVNFYFEESIVSVKQKLYDVAKKLLCDKGVGRVKDRRSSDNKKKLDTKDLLELYTKLDKEKAMLPLFVAATLAKVPGDTPAECDVSVFAATLSDLKLQITDLQHTVSSLAKNMSSGQEPGIRSDTFYLTSGWRWI